MNILILGARGFIGSYLINHFLSKECLVVGCDLLEYSSSEYKYHKVSILSSDFENLFSQYKFDVCLNASGSGNVGYSMASPLSDFEANTFSVAKVLDTIRKQQPSCKYIHLSSAAVYGNPQVLPIQENIKLTPVSPYGFHKWMSELLCKEYFDLYNLRITILRPFSVYGRGLRKQLLWDICQKLNDSNEPFLFGTGKETRDFIHISDLVLIINEIIHKSDFNCEVYNAASGIETSIEEVSKIFSEHYPGKKRIHFSGELKKGDPVNWRAEISKIRKLNFQPKVALKEGIIDYINYYLNIKN